MKSFDWRFVPQFFSQEILESMGTASNSIVFFIDFLQHLEQSVDYISFSWEIVIEALRKTGIQS
jgi:hypothetical protein